MKKKIMLAVCTVVPVAVLVTVLHRRKDGYPDKLTRRAKVRGPPHFL